jgi:hypothetical protein
MHWRFRLCDQSAQAGISRRIKSSGHKVKHSLRKRPVGTNSPRSIRLTIG